MFYLTGNTLSRRCLCTATSLDGSLCPSRQYCKLYTNLPLSPISIKTHVRKRSRSLFHGDQCLRLSLVAYTPISKKAFSCPDRTVACEPGESEICRWKVHRMYGGHNSESNGKSKLSRRTGYKHSPMSPFFRSMWRQEKPASVSRAFGISLKTAQDLISGLTHG